MSQLYIIHSNRNNYHLFFFIYRCYHYYCYFYCYYFVIFIIFATKIIRFGLECNKKQSFDNNNADGRKVKICKKTYSNDCYNYDFTQIKRSRSDIYKYIYMVFQRELVYHRKLFYVIRLLVYILL